jgi:flavin reductase (DIM6/NTAB) family NADH-FMN oxidoreductase RutF
MPLDPQILRLTMRQWATGVTVVTSVAGADRSGMTVSSFTSVSLEPPTVLVCLNKNTHTHALVAKSGVYAISLLAANQEALSNRFAGFEPDLEDRFDGVPIATAETGAPLLVGALAWLDCRVKQSVDTSTHTIYIGEVVDVQVHSEDEPLIYHNRRYRLLVDLPPAKG